jgi:hypothetical protein
MRTGLWLLLVALAVRAPAQASGNDARLLTGFEDESSLRQWELQDASAERVEQHATEGRDALQLTLSPGQYPGVLLPRGSPLLTGWDGYDFARLDVFNPQAAPVTLTVRIDDAHSVNFSSRYNDDFVMRPGRNTLELPLRRLQTSDHQHNLDVSQLKQLMIFASDVRSPIVLFFDNLRLENVSVVTNGGTVRTFDFGPHGSPGMQGFIGVGADDLYDKARGWGWIAPCGLAAFDDELPDSLCRSYVGPEEGVVVANAFAVDVPNGEYQIVACTRDSRAFDPYRGIDHDWWPGKDVWKEEILPKFPERISRITVTNEEVTLAFTNAVYWLAILPSESNNWLESLRAARRREFYEKYFYLEPYHPPSNPSRIKLAAARGQTISVILPRGSGLPSATGFPESVQIDFRAVRLMERPVGRGAYRIEEMALMPLASRPHAQELAFTVHVATNAKEGVYKGEVAGIPVELRVWPFELPSVRELDMTFGWYYDSPNDPAMRDRELRDMVDHGFNSVTAIRPVVRADGSLDTARADEFLGAAHRAELVGTHPVPVETLMIARRLSHVLGVAEFSEDFLPTYKRALSAFREWTRAKPFPVVAHVVDEPREQALNDWNRNFADTKRYLELHHAAGLKTMVTLTSDSSFGKSYLPLLDWLDIVSAHPDRGSRRILDAAQDGKPVLWLYNAGMNRFTYGFYPWAVSAKGRWEWHYESWTHAYDPFARTPESAWSTGTGAVMPSPDGPLPTVAYEKVRAGVDDYRYLWMLERLIAANSQRGTIARQFLSEVRGKIPRYPEDAARIDDATMDEWREKIAGFIVALAGEGERNRDTDSGRPSAPPPPP